MKIAIETLVNAPLRKVWEAWNSAEDIVNWNFASNEWCCPRAETNFTVGGQFSNRMEAKDGSMGFDFGGTFTAIVPMQNIEFKLEDDRLVSVEFQETDDGIRVVETFEAEDENSAEMQRQGWLAILGNFKAYVEAK